MAPPALPPDHASGVHSPVLESPQRACSDPVLPLRGRRPRLAAALARCGRTPPPPDVLTLPFPTWPRFSPGVLLARLPPSTDEDAAPAWCGRLFPPDGATPPPEGAGPAPPKVPPPPPARDGAAAVEGWRSRPRWTSRHQEGGGGIVEEGAEEMLKGGGSGSVEARCGHVGRGGRPRRGITGWRCVPPRNLCGWKPFNMQITWSNHNQLRRVMGRACTCTSYANKETVQDVFFCTLALRKDQSAPPSGRTLTSFPRPDWADDALPPRSATPDACVAVHSSTPPPRDSR